MMIDNNNANPPVFIAMATYNPNMIWLKEQLESLNSQTYPNITLKIIDDKSTSVGFDKIKELVANTITQFPWSIEQNEKNQGSNKTFEKLTEQSMGEYIAYCDQDDIWLPEKIEKLVALIQDKHSDAVNTLVCSDVFVVDEQGKITANSITEVRKRHIFKTGVNLAPELLFRNFVIGCTMLMPINLAKEAMPFVQNMVHDHYLALFAATRGNIKVSEENLIYYRIHGGNQTNVLVGVRTKEEYYNDRIQTYLGRTQQLKQRFDIDKLEEAYIWAKARDDYYHRVKNSGIIMWKHRKLEPNMTMFELVMLRLPDCVFKFALRRIQRGSL